MVRPQYTLQQRAFLLTEYHRHSRNVARVLESFREQYPAVRCLSRATVYKNVVKYRANGTSLKLNRGRSGRSRSARTQEDIEAVRNAIQNWQKGDEKISARRNGVGVSSATFNRITRLDLQFHPFQMIRRHQLLPGDYQR